MILMKAYLGMDESKNIRLFIDGPMGLTTAGYRLERGKPFPASVSSMLDGKRPTTEQCLIALREFQEYLDIHINYKTKKTNTKPKEEKHNPLAFDYVPMGNVLQVDFQPKPQSIANDNDNSTPNNDRSSRKLKRSNQPEGKRKRVILKRRINH